MMTLKLLSLVLKEVRANFWPMSKSEEDMLIREAKELSRTFTSYKSEWGAYEKWDEYKMVNVGPPMKMVLQPENLLLIVNIRWATSRFYYDGAAFCPTPFWMAWGFQSERHAIGSEYRQNSNSRYSDQELLRTAEEVIQNLPELEISVFNKIMSDKNQRAAFVAECVSMIVERDTHTLTLIEDNGDCGEPRTPLMLAKKIVGYINEHSHAG